MRTSRHILKITLLSMAVVMAAASDDQPLGRNYRKNGLFISNAHNNGKIPAAAESKVTAVSLRPGQLSGLSSFDQLKTSASDNKDSFSIGLGVLSPSYSQKFGEDGKTKLDFNSDQGGFSYSLTNVVHPTPNQQPAAASAPPAAAASPIASKVQSEGFVPSAYYNNPAQANPQVNIYHKQTADANAIYGRLSPNQYPAPPATPTATPTANPANQAAAYNAAQQAAFGGYGSYPAPAQQAAPANNPLANFPAFASGLTDAEKSFLQTVPPTPQSNAGQYNPAAVQPQQQIPSYPGAAAAGQVSPYASNPYAAQHVHQAPNTYTPNSLPAAPGAAAAGYAAQPSQPQPNPYAPYAAASSTQPKLVSQQQLTANPTSANIMHAAPNPYAAPNADPFINQYMAAAASMYNPQYASMGASASSAYPSMNPYDLMGDFMY